jgi:hypothetical protein
MERKWVAASRRDSTARDPNLGMIARITCSLNGRTKSARLMGCTEFAAQSLFCRAKKALAKKLLRHGLGVGGLSAAAREGLRRGKTIIRPFGRAEQCGG